MREWRHTHSVVSDEQRVKAATRAVTKVYQSRGVWPKGPCEQCGATKSENHHPDYSNPRRYHRLCRECHLRVHREMDAGLVSTIAAFGASS